MKAKKFRKFLKHPVKSYANYIRHTIIPKPYSHRIVIPINIRKGEQSGNALIPCTIYAMDHSLDLNPALIRKKDKKIMQNFQANKNHKYITDNDIRGYRVKGKKVIYNPNDYVLELTENEKNKGYILKELERCRKCGQKLVIAELQATRYRSCPSVKVKLGDNAKEDIIIPVEYGINKSDITRRYWITPILFFCLIYITILMTTGFDFISWLTNKLNFGIAIPSQANGYIYWIIIGMLLVFIWLIFIPIHIYGTYKLFQWYNSVKHTLRKVKY